MANEQNWQDKTLKRGQAERMPQSKAQRTLQRERMACDREPGPNLEGHADDEGAADAHLRLHVDLACLCGRHKRDNQGRLWGQNFESQSSRASETVRKRSGLQASHEATNTQEFSQRKPTQNRLMN